jgi:hypothetical protein
MAALCTPGIITGNELKSPLQLRHTPRQASAPSPIRPVPARRRTVQRIPPLIPRQKPAAELAPPPLSGLNTHRKCGELLPNKPHRPGRSPARLRSHPRVQLRGRPLQPLDPPLQRVRIPTAHPSRMRFAENAVKRPCNSPTNVGVSLFLGTVIRIGNRGRCFAR